MKYLASLLYVLGPLSVGALALLLAALGRRLGEALELPPYYRLYYVSFALFLLPLPAMWIIVFTGAWGMPDPSPKTGMAIKLAAASLPIAVAFSLALVATARYWGWLWGELGRARDGKGGGDGD